MNRTRSSFAAIGFLLLGACLISANYTSSKMSIRSAPPRSGGLANIANQDRTGSPISSGLCSSCHFGGSFAPSFQVEVKDAGNNVVNSYTPGAQYTVEYTVAATSGSPGGYGMQATMLTSSNANAGNHGTVNTANTQVSTIGGVQFLEQSGVNSSGFFSVNWTAPVAGTGTVTIYGNGIAVNGNGGTSGDSGSSAFSLSLSEDVPTTIDFPGNPYCSNVANPTPVITGEQGGSFSAPAGLNINTSSGEIDLLGSTPGTYTVTYTGATETATFDVTINQTYSVSDAATICSNETFQFGSQTLTAANAGVNTEIFQATNGCDSTVNLTLTVLQNPVTQLSQTICSNETIQFNGQTLDASNAGLNTFTTTGSNGCDSTVELTLNVLPLDTVQIAETICQGETFDFNGQILDESNAGLNVATLSNINGCDSIVELTLNVTSIDTTLTIGVWQLTANQTTGSYQWYNCDADTLMIGETNQDINLSQAGTYAAIITLNGCVDTTNCEVPIMMGVEENKQSAIHVFPSPASQTLYVQNISELSEVDHMQIVNLSGQQIWSSGIALNEIAVDHLPSGTYFLKVRHAKGEDVVKFLKQ
ncbi:MAG: T9SS type A sorting domain-containing protein [Fluviicola sp.]